LLPEADCGEFVGGVLGSNCNRNAKLALTALLVPMLASAQSLEVDHVWIQVSPNAPELQALVDAGFDPDPRGTITHTGMGTASNLIRFHNIYLELIWVDDPVALREVAPSYAVAMLGGPDASPFGIGLRDLSRTGELPLEATTISAEWMQPWGGVVYSLNAESEPASDPRVIVIPDSMRWDSRVTADPTVLQAAQNDLGVEAVSRIRIFGQDLPSSSGALRYLSDRDLVVFEPANDSLMELEFDEGGTNVLDLRPTLPLVLRYPVRQ